MLFPTSEAGLESSMRRLHLTDEMITPEETRTHEFLGIDLLVVNVTLIVLIVTAIWAEQRHIPASAAAIVVGALIGGLLRLTGGDMSEIARALPAVGIFNEEIFMYILLPPIIFEAGFSLSKRYFFSNMTTILVFAVLGTLLSTFIVGQMCQWAGVMGFFEADNADALDFRSPHDSYLFGALISATDRESFSRARNSDQSRLTHSHQPLLLRLAKR